jgi:succinate dehydrogenase/fumarate reductase flavoprotein subunit
LTSCQVEENVDSIRADHEMINELRMAAWNHAVILDEEREELRELKERLGRAVWLIEEFWNHAVALDEEREQQRELKERLVRAEWMIQEAVGRAEAARCLCGEGKGREGPNGAGSEDGPSVMAPLVKDEYLGPSD